ncbi:MAG: hypothetical protein LBP21_05360 [Synergistaceae bacterium]|nr:hypothetical protein [Synergistaceae bacterium]
MRNLNARDQFRELGNQIIRDPLSTHIIKTATRDEKVRYLVVDRGRLPKAGDVAVICTPFGLRAERIKEANALGDVWGKVVWYIQES